MATLLENRKWAKDFNDKIDAIGNDNLKIVFSNQKNLFDELVFLSANILKLLKDHEKPNSFDVAESHRALFLRLVRLDSTIKSLVLIEYLVFLEDAKLRMVECPEFRDHCLKMNTSNLIPHQFTQQILKFAALFALDIDDDSEHDPESLLHSL